MSRNAQSSGKSRSYARGTHAIAECQRSGQKMRYKDLVEDGHIYGLLVHPDWWEPKHPQEVPVTVTDPIALFRPAPEISIPAGHGLPENLDGGTTPTTPVGAADTTIAVRVEAGDTQVVCVDAVKYIIGQWVAVATGLTGTTWFFSRITTTCDSPSFVIPFTSIFPGTPDGRVGENVYIFD